MKYYIFESKENYLEMKKRWAHYFNTEVRKLEKNEYGNKIKKLTVTHFIFYAILRGKDPQDCIQKCSWETLTCIKFDLSLVKYSKNRFRKKAWKDFFGITDEEFERVFEIAYGIFHEKKSFTSIKREIKPLSEEKMATCLAQKPYIYIFLRKDLDKNYQIIQTGHVLFEHALKLKEKPKDISSFCLLEARDEKHLHKIILELEMSNLNFTTFYEPDYNTGYTAIAVGPIYGKERNKFKKYKMFKE